MDALTAAYEASRERLPGVSLAEFVKAAEQWEVHPVTVQGETAGAIMVRGPEIHACVMPWAKGLWIGKRQLRVLFEVMKRHGYAVTKATTDQGRHFVEQLGFVPDGDVYRKAA